MRRPYKTHINTLFALSPQPSALSPQPSAQCLPPQLCGNVK
jgi:hypothetical protein